MTDHQLDRFAFDQLGGETEVDNQCGIFEFEIYTIPDWQLLTRYGGETRLHFRSHIESWREVNFILSTWPFKVRKQLSEESLRRLRRWKELLSQLTASSRLSMRVSEATCRTSLYLQGRYRHEVMMKHGPSQQLWRKASERVRGTPCFSDFRTPPKLRIRERLLHCSRLVSGSPSREYDEHASLPRPGDTVRIDEEVCTRTKYCHEQMASAWALMS